MAKQEAFEEKMRLKNQFRALDEDEVDFLDSVLESTRAQEAAVKKDTADQLEVFRKQREEAEKAMLGPTSSEVAPAEEEEWTIPARKRRRDKSKELLVSGKKRKASVAESNHKADAFEKEEARKASQGSETAAASDHQARSTATSGAIRPQAAGNAAKEPPGNTQQSKTDQKVDHQPAKTTTGSLGLVGYGSDSDSE